MTTNMMMVAKQAVMTCHLLREFGLTGYLPSAIHKATCSTG